MPKNLEGIRVLDFSISRSGAFISMMMRDMGAEVVMIEPPDGNPMRRMEPLAEGAHGVQSGYFLSLCRGKKSVVFDILREPPAALDRLLDWADVVIENYTPGTPEHARLDFTRIHPRNPGLILCSISLYGQEGPLAFLPPYDILAQAASGLMWLTGDRDRYPQPEGAEVGEISAATHGLGAITAALYYRGRTGIGQHIDISMRDCLSAILETTIPTYELLGEVIGRCGSHHPAYAPYGVFDAGNGKSAVVAAISNTQWQRLAAAIGREELADAEDYQLASDRGRHFDAIKAMLEEYLKSGSDYIDQIDRLIAYKVPSAPVQSIEDLLRDEQFLSRGNLCRVDDDTFGPVDLPVTPMVFSETDVRNTASAPALGQDTDEFLSALLNG